MAANEGDALGGNAIRLKRFARIRHWERPYSLIGVGKRALLRIGGGLGTQLGRRCRSLGRLRAALSLAPGDLGDPFAIAARFEGVLVPIWPAV